MKWILILTALISPLANADFNFEIRHTDLKYKWGDKADFPLKMVQAGFNYNKNGFSIGVIGGESDKRTSRGPWVLPVELKNFFTLTVTQDIKINNNLSLFIGATYSEYKEVVNGKAKSDTGDGTVYGLKYKAFQDITIKLSADKYYQKNSKSIGLETTDGFGVSLLFDF
jgi:hypothetical protein